MLKKKNIGIALACALAFGAWSGTTLAAPVNVGGVMIDPTSPLFLTIDAQNFRESSVANVGDVLTGYGKIGSINGTDQSEFCPGCDLTFTFQYRVKDIDITNPSTPKVVFDMGVVNFYRDDTSSFSVLNPDSATLGTLWLSLGGHAAPYTGFSTLGELYSTITGPVSQPGSQSSGFGLLDAVSGPAFGFMDLNSQTDGSDFVLSSSFQTKPANGCSTVSANPSDLCHYPITGTANLTSDSTPVPEPGAAGILGLGLAFLGLFAWRRNKEADGRA
jgi:hypothetical protein